MVFWNYETFIMIWYYSTEDHKIIKTNILRKECCPSDNVSQKCSLSSWEQKQSSPLPKQQFLRNSPPPHASPPFSTLFFLEQKSLFFDLLMSVIKSYKTLDFSKHAPHIMTLHTWKQSQIYYNKVYHIHMSL